MRSVLEQNSFFRGRVKNQGRASFVTKIKSYGLIRSGNIDDKPAMLPSVVLEASIVGESGKQIGAPLNNPVIFGVSNRKHTTEQLAASSSLQRDAYADALIKAMEILVENLAKRTAE